MNRWVKFSAIVLLVVAWSYNVANLAPSHKMLGIVDTLFFILSGGIASGLIITECGLLKWMMDD